MEKERQQRVRFPAVVLGVILAAVICILTPVNNIYNQGTPLGGGHFPLAPFFVFFLMAILVSIIARFTRGRYLFNGIELLVIWVQMVIGSGIAYTGFARTFLLNITAPHHFNSMGSLWGEKLTPIFPEQLSPDSEAIRLLYNGIENGRSMELSEVIAHIPWGGWLSPFVYWGMFILVSYFVMFCIVNILSRQWIHNERMNFPLLQVPKMIGKAVDNRNLKSFLFDRFLLVGLLVPLSLH